MLILRKLGSNLSNNVLISDILLGVLDGNNQIFTLSNEYISGRIEIIFNGQVLSSGIDFDETGPKEITFKYILPEEGDILRANYEISSGSTTGGDLKFLDLTDTPSSYFDKSGALLAVNESGTGIEFIVPTGEYKEGIYNIPQGSSTVTVPFDSALSTDTYVLNIDLENHGDIEPSIYSTLIKSKSNSGFLVEFSGEIDSNNYYINWSATVSGGNSFNLINNDINFDLQSDPNPTLSNDLAVESNLIVLDTQPDNGLLHGYTIGYSGEASDMYVSINDTGFACPLYIRSDGNLAQCTAVSGTVQMPCVALALDEGDGGTKKVLWKGFVRKGTWSWTPGKPVYVSTIEGALTVVPPTGGAWVQPIGFTVKQDTIRFDPGFNPGYISQ